MAAKLRLLIRKYGRRKIRVTVST